MKIELLRELAYYHSFSWFLLPVTTKWLMKSGSTDKTRNKPVLANIETKKPIVQKKAEIPKQIRTESQ